MSSLPITVLDLVLIGVMLISAVLAMIRGFIREVLSIAAWVIAAAAAIYGYLRLVPWVKTLGLFSSDIVNTAVTVGGTFLLTLIIVSIVTVRFSDMVLDSRVGALDRTLGFLFGLGRGLVIVVVAYLFFDWLVPERTQPGWVTAAKSKPLLDWTGDELRGLLPDENFLSKVLKKRANPDEDTDDKPGIRGGLEPSGQQRTAS